MNRKFLDFCKQFKLIPFPKKKVYLKNITIYINTPWGYRRKKSNLYGWQIFYKEKPYFAVLINKEDWCFSIYEFVKNNLTKKMYLHYIGNYFYNKITNRWEIE